MPGDKMTDQLKNEVTETASSFGTLKKIIQNKPIKVSISFLGELADLYGQLNDEYKNISALLNDIINKIDPEIEEADQNKNHRKTYLLQSYEKAVVEACDAFTKLVKNPESETTVKEFKSAINKLSNEKYSANLATTLLHKTEALLIALSAAAGLIGAISLALAFMFPPFMPILLPIAAISAATSMAASCGSLIFGPLANTLAFTSSHVRQAARLEYQLTLAAFNKSDALSNGQKCFGLFRGLTNLKLRAISADPKLAIELKSSM